MSSQNRGVSAQGEVFYLIHTRPLNGLVALTLKQPGRMCSRCPPSLPCLPPQGHQKHSSLVSQARSQHNSDCEGPSSLHRTPRSLTKHSAGDLRERRRNFAKAHQRATHTVNTHWVVPWLQPVQHACLSSLAHRQPLHYLLPYNVRAGSPPYPVETDRSNQTAPAFK